MLIGDFNKQKNKTKTKRFFTILDELWEIDSVSELFGVPESCRWSRNSSLFMSLINSSGKSNATWTLLAEDLFLALASLYFRISFGMVRLQPPSSTSACDPWLSNNWVAALSTRSITSSELLYKKKDEGVNKYSFIIQRMVS